MRNAESIPHIGGLRIAVRNAESFRKRNCPILRLTLDPSMIAAKLRPKCGREAVQHKIVSRFDVISRLERIDA